MAFSSSILCPDAKFPSYQSGKHTAKAFTAQDEIRSKPIPLTVWVQAASRKDHIIRKTLIFDGLFTGIEMGQPAFDYTEDKERISADAIVGRGGQSHLPRIEILQHFISI